MAIRSPKWLFLAALVLASPDTAGVYELWDDDQVIRIGSADGRGQTLRSRLVAELFTEERHVSHFSWEITSAPDQRERELLDELAAAQKPAARGK
jgi:hypothetical protein